MFSTPLERTVRRQVRARLRSSEMLWREYLPRRRIERWHAAGRIGAILFSPILIAAAVSFIAMTAVLQHGIGLLMEEGPLVGTDNGPLLPLVFNAVFLVSASCMAIAELRAALIRSKSLVQCAYFPVADQDFRRARVWKSAGWWVYAMFTAPVLGWLAYERGLTVFGWFVVATLALLQGLVCDAVVITFIGYSSKPWSRDWLSMFGVFVAVACLIAALGGAHLVRFDEAISWPAFFLLPSGWINGAFHYGLLEGQPAAWLLLVPATAVIVAAWRWLHAPYSVLEFTFPAPCEAEAEFAPDVLRKPASSRWGASTKRLAAADYPASASEADELGCLPISTQTLLAPLDWSRRGWLERFIASRLTERERLLFETHLGASKSWTATWYLGVACFAAAAATMVFARPPDPLSPMLQLLGLFLGGWYLNPETAGRQAATGAWQDYHPVGFGELASMARRTTLWRMVAISPFAAATAVVGEWLAGVAWSSTAVRLVAMAVVALGLHQMGFCLSVSARTNDTARWRFLLLWPVAVTFVVGGAFAMILVVSPLWFSLIAALVAVTAWIFGHYYARAFDRCDFDIVR